MNDGARDLVLGTAGHIDHGKTALVRALTGVDTDRLPAEKERGITIDLGFASLELDGIHLAVVDVPGHERFIRNMLAGASGLDLALLIVAADDSVMPQTREHLEILRLLGLSGGVIAITKCDLVDSSWLDLVEEDVRGLVCGSFLEGAPIVRTSTVSGQGLDLLRDALGRVSKAVGPRNDRGLFRIAIDRSFTVAGHGTVVTGTVASGWVSVGDELEWQPAGRSVRVRGLHRHDHPVERVGRGARGDQPGGCSSRRDPPRAGAGFAGLSGCHAGSVGRRRRLGRCRPPAAPSWAVQAAPWDGRSIGRLVASRAGRSGHRRLPARAAIRRRADRVGARPALCTAR
jgi:small GTP-binding protein